MLDESTLNTFQSPMDKQKSSEDKDLALCINRAVELLRKSSRPVLLVGSGVRNSGAEQDLSKLLNKLGIPILVSRRGNLI